MKIVQLRSMTSLSLIEKYTKKSIKLQEIIVKNIYLFGKSKSKEEEFEIIVLELMIYISFSALSEPLSRAYSNA
ncbi:hypothetical protein PNK_1687 [Candidatus Protochlamydia naegleriophila]|uniref:Uncharacterized protein n=1 Tax=Candidatus Protochlamydia naegleriophila TaxID=389348 RepID=A0A0U5EST8_9BACT|nr:hypothetical protein PNK_1687 [Candidatus Protochlamydia naegleriophila]